MHARRQGVRANHFLPWVGGDILGPSFGWKGNIRSFGRPLLALTAGCLGAAAPGSRRASPQRSAAFGVRESLLGGAGGRGRKARKAPFGGDGAQGFSPQLKLRAAGEYRLGSSQKNQNGTHAIEAPPLPPSFEFCSWRLGAWTQSPPQSQRKISLAWKH